MVLRLVDDQFQWFGPDSHNSVLMLFVILLDAGTAAQSLVGAVGLETDDVESLAVVVAGFVALQVLNNRVVARHV